MSAQSSQATHARSAILSFIGMSAVAGLLVAAAATPAVVVTGLAASGAIGIFETLPDYLDIDKLAQKTKIYAKSDDNTEVLIASFFAQNREEVPLSEISPCVPLAAVAAEDKGYFDHRGINFWGTIRAGARTILGLGFQGGSGIDQQAVKNFLAAKKEASPNPPEQRQKRESGIANEFADKIKEAKLAIGLEKRYSKDVILQAYLNVIYFGANVYGIESAAKYYFNVPAKDLTLAQSATLVSIVNNPEVLRIDRPNNPANGAANSYGRTTDRRNYILKSMLRDDKITQEQFDEAQKSAITPTITPTSNGCESAKGAAYFCQYVKNVILNDEAYGADADDRFANFRRGGYEIHTSLDLRLQHAAEQEINRVMPKSFDGKDLAATAVSVEVGTGRILMMVQSKDYTEDPEVADTGKNYTSINYNTDKDHGGSSGFQPGSTYKVFTLAEWLKKGHTVTESFDGRRRNWTPMNDRCADHPVTDPYNPVNDDGSGGGMTNAKVATEQSLNSSYMAMAKQLDLCDIRDTAMAFKMHRADGKPLAHVPSSVLGVAEVAPLSVATAFTGFANSGKTCSPVAIDKIVRPDGSEAPAPKSDCTQSVDPSVAAAANVALDGVMKNGTGRKSRTSDGTPLIGKSGTSDENYDSWMTVASTKVSTSAWLGNVSAVQGSKTNLRKFSISGVSADQARHLYMKPILEAANRLYPGGAFPGPSAAPPQQPLDKQITVPDVRGMPAATAESTLKGFGFIPVKGDDVDDALPAGNVARSEPAAGAVTAKGASVTYFTSKGTLATALLTVPDVTGKPFEEALNALTQAGLTVRQKDVSVADQAKDNTVARTEPSAGSSAKPGTSITVFKNEYRPEPAAPPPPRGAPGRAR